MQFSALSLAMLLAACGSDQGIGFDASILDASTKPSITAAASPGTVAPGAAVTLTVTVKNFTVVDPRPGPAPKAGEGHYHYYLDAEPNYTAGWTPTVSIRTSPTTSLGVHTVRFVLVNSAHEEVTPIVEGSTTFTVQ